METETVYEILVEGHLDEHWTAWFYDMQLENCPDGTARLTGPIPDQSALQGVINRIFDLNLRLLLVRKVS